MLEPNLEVFPQTATYQSIPAEYGDEKGTRIGRLVDASITLRAAGLSYTWDNLDALTPNPSRDYFYALKMGESEKFFRFGEMRDQLDCAAEIEKLMKEPHVDRHQALARFHAGRSCWPRIQPIFAQYSAIY